MVIRGVFNVGKGLNGPNARNNPMVITCTTASKNKLERGEVINSGPLLIFLSLLLDSNLSSTGKINICQGYNS